VLGHAFVYTGLHQQRITELVERDMDELIGDPQ